MVQVKKDTHRDIYKYTYHIILPLIIILIIKPL